MIIKGAKEPQVFRSPPLLIRERTWELPGEETQQDYVKFRMIFPMELEYYLTIHGFKVVGMFDNTDLNPSELLDRSLYVASIFQCDS